MDPTWHKGNAAIDSAGHRGWLVGHFIDGGDIRSSKDVEIKWGIHPAGEERPDWSTDEYRTTVVVLVRGRFRVNLSTEPVLLADEGDYVMWGPGIDHTWHAEADSVVLTIRWPSTRDQTAVPRNDDGERIDVNIADLPLRDRLLHGIGQVAQAQVSLEMVLRNLFTSLAGPTPAVALATARRSITALVDDCKIMVEYSTLADEIKAAGLEALSYAQEADRLRNRVVHDWWSHSTGDDPEAPALERTRLQNSRGGVGYRAEPSDLSYIEDAYDRLSRALIRISQLHFAAGDLLFQRDTFDHDELLETIRGEFDLMPNGGWRRKSLGPPAPP